MSFLHSDGRIIAVLWLALYEGHVANDLLHLSTHLLLEGVFPVEEPGRTIMGCFLAIVWVTEQIRWVIDGFIHMDDVSSMQIFWEASHAPTLPISSPFVDVIVTEVINLRQLTELC